MRHRLFWDHARECCLPASHRKTLPRLCSAKSRQSRLQVPNLTLCKAKLRDLTGSVQRLNPVIKGLTRSLQQTTGKIIFSEPVQLLRALQVLLSDCRGVCLAAFFFALIPLNN